MLKRLKAVRGFLITGIIFGITAFILTVIGTYWKETLLHFSIGPEFFSGKLPLYKLEFVLTVLTHLMPRISLYTP